MQHRRLDHQPMTLAARKDALADKAQRDAGLLDLHRLVIERMRDPLDARRIRNRALEQVHKWSDRRLCSPRYIAAWEGILAMPMDDFAQAVLRSDAEGIALRQNTPFGFMGRA